MRRERDGKRPTDLGRGRDKREREGGREGKVGGEGNRG